MLILKIGGSVFAPKKSKKFDTKLLGNLSYVLSEIYKQQIILVHGNGNIGHGFVSEYGVSRETLEMHEQVKKPFFSKMEEIFSGYKRIGTEDIIRNRKNVKEELGNCIIGGDIDSISLDILSGDDVFAKVARENIGATLIMMTDVSGVLDSNDKLIKKVKLSEIDKIVFWEKEGDVTHSMKGKMMALEKYIPDNSRGIWIINGHNLDNLKNIIQTGEGIGTLVTR